MPERDKDDLADALSKLASGEHTEGQDVAPSPSAPPEQPPQKQQAPASSVKSSKPVTPVPARPSFRPPVPGAAAPRIRPSSAPPPRARPVAPGSPTDAPRVEDAPKSRPTAPAKQVSQPSSQPSPQEQPVARDDGMPSSEMISSALENVIETDEVDAPAPQQEVFAPRRITPRPRRLPLYARLGFRRTLIPILLTLGVSFPVLAGLWLRLGDESPFKNPDLPFPAAALPLTLLCVGLVMLALAVLNMMQVKKQMNSAAQAR